MQHDLVRTTFNMAANVVGEAGAAEEYAGEGVGSPAGVQDPTIVAT